MRRIKKSELREAAVLIVEQFMEGEQLKRMLQGINADTIQQFAVEIFYGQLLYLYKRGDIFVNDDSIDGVIIGMDKKKSSTLYKMLLSAKAVRKTFKLLSKDERKLFMKNVKVAQETIDMKWHKKHNKDAYHLAIFAINTESQGSGLCRKMLEHLFEHAKNHKIMILETHDTKNVPLYEHFGFELVETKETKDKTLTEYRMLKK
jgi:ribosomal protein S18 acetylase RimI-like enzyme